VVYDFEKIEKMGIIGQIVTTFVVALVGIGIVIGVGLGVKYAIEKGIDKTLSLASDAWSGAKNVGTGLALDFRDELDVWWNGNKAVVVQLQRVDPVDVRMEALGEEHEEDEDPTEPPVLPSKSVVFVEYGVLPIERLDQAQERSLNHTRAHMVLLHGTMTEVDGRLHTFETDLADVMYADFRAFVADYRNYSKTLRRATIKCDECYQLHQAYRASMKAVFTHSESETKEHYADRIISQHSALTKKHDALYDCYLEHEKWYRAALDLGESLAKQCRNTRVSYSKVSKAISNGWSFGKIAREYGFAAAVAYVPAAYCVDPVSAIAAAAVGLVYKATSHINDKHRKYPLARRNIAKIKGWTRLTENMVNVHTRYLAAHIATLFGLKLHFGDLGTSLSHLVSPLGVGVNRVVNATEFCARYISNVIRDLDALEEKRSKIEQLTSLLLDLEGIRKALTPKLGANKG
jgi:hypothetical protein